MRNIPLAILVLAVANGGTLLAQEPAVPAGPVGYWKLDEGSGGTALNSAAGGGAHGTHHGAPGPSTVVPPVSYANLKSLSFNGASQCVAIPNFGSFTTTTVAAWIRRTGSTTARETIVSYKDGPASTSGFILAINQNGVDQKPRFWVMVGGVSNWCEENFTVPADTWIHLAGTYDGAALRLYRDGLLVASKAVAGAMTNSDAQITAIGARASLDRHYFPGLIDDVRIYERALSATEIAILAAGCPAPTGLVGDMNGSQVPLSWSAPSGPNPGYSYTVKRGTVSGTYTTIAQGIPTTSYVDATIDPSVTYYYVVSAVGAAESGPTNERVVKPPVTALPNSGLFTSENGATTAFNIAFNRPASAGGSLVTVTSSNPAEGVVSTSFPGATATAGGFQVVVDPGTSPTIPVVVAGVDDSTADGAVPYTVSVTASGMNATIPDVRVTNNDNDIPGITFSRTSGFVTTESGGEDTFVVSLNTQPHGSITLTLASSNLAEGTVSPATILFTPANWNAPQSVTLTGVDDAALDFTQPYTVVSSPLTISHPGDFGYDAMKPPDVAATNLDDEVIPALEPVWGGSGGCGLTGLEAWLILGMVALLGRRR